MSRIMLKPDVRLTEEVERHRCDDISKCCSQCLLPSENLKRCAQCKEVQYCSKQCQKKAWTSGHKVSCGKIALQEIPGQVKFKSLLGFISGALTVSQLTVSHRTVSHRTISHRTVSHRTFSHRTVSQLTVSHRTFSHRTFSQRHFPNGHFPIGHFPSDIFPSDIFPAIFSQWTFSQ